MQLKKASNHQCCYKQRKSGPLSSSSSSWLVRTITTTFAIEASSATSPRHLPLGFVGQRRHPSIQRRTMHPKRIDRNRYSSQEISLRFARYMEECVDEEHALSTPPMSLGDAIITDDNRYIEDNTASTDIHSSTKKDLVDNERSLGILILLTVPLAWGTYTPVVKYMYDRMDPPVPGFVFSAGYYLVAAIVLSALNLRSSKSDSIQINLAQGEPNNWYATLGGLELGSYLFLGNGFQVVGLQTVPADRAAFLVQLTTVMVPLVSAWLSGQGLASVPILTWGACAIALLGVIVMGMDDNGQPAEAFLPDHVDWDNILSSVHISHGDGLIILAALAYSMHVVRLGNYAPKTRPLDLAAAKARTEATFSVLVVMVLALIGKVAGNRASLLSVPDFAQRLGEEVLNYFGTITTTDVPIDVHSPITESSSVLIFVAAILWTGLITSAYTIYAQSYGQRRINPVDSNLIYTTQPLFSSLFAYALLGEKLGVCGWVGAGLIGVALGLVAFGFEGDK
ncbi:hypothetical protein ACHAW6_003370 [Cyclotella cf. meneghiniana]